MKNYYIVNENNKIFFISCKTLDGLPFYNAIGSYNVLKARLFDLTYASFLRMARDIYGAQLHGKKGYITEFFVEKNKAIILCKELNCLLNQLT